MDNGGDVQGLIAAIEALPVKPVLISVDNLARTMSGNENQQEDMSAYIRGIDRIMRATGAHLQVLHHTGWNQERERGSTTLRAAADTLALLTKDDNFLTLRCLKQKDAEPFVDLLLELRPAGGSAVLVPVDAATRDRRPVTVPRTRQAALDTLRAIDDGSGVSFTAWFEQTGLTRPTFERCVADLGSWGLISRTGKKYRANANES